MRLDGSSTWNRDVMGVRSLVREATAVGINFVKYEEEGSWFIVYCLHEFKAMCIKQHTSTV